MREHGRTTLLSEVEGERGRTRRVLLSSESSREEEIDRFLSGLCATGCGGRVTALKRELGRDGILVIIICHVYIPLIIIIWPAYFSNFVKESLVVIIEVKSLKPKLPIEAVPPIKVYIIGELIRLYSLF